MNHVTAKKKKSHKSTHFDIMHQHQKRLIISPMVIILIVKHAHAVLRRQSFALNQARKHASSQ